VLGVMEKLPFCSSSVSKLAYILRCDN
jgi:hypothetical protein